ncbi:MAG: IS1634 family transposase [Candidatus Polarisedimenticolaceae bacterium]|nr:IS1634 family transposase [Candidatus Polarisedimenticolaceae bacterium]
MAYPASERASHQWLQQRSGLGELIGYDYEAMGLERLYQASDMLWQHREALQAHLYGEERSLFDLEETVTLYDLTNTFFEGAATANPKATYGRSKEKRSDCPLVTLGLVLDSSGFPRKSEIFSGNAAEAKTLEAMLAGLGAEEGTIVVMDAGIASEDNIQWLIDHGYRYLVVSRKRKRDFDANEAVTVKNTPGQSVQVQRIVNEQTGEVELYCHSEMREKKEQAMQDRFAERFETALQSLSNGLHKKGTTKRHEKVLERIGRLKEKYARAAQHYEIKVIPDPGTDKTQSIHWKRKEKPNTQATHPGVYCLRANIDDWDEERLWKTYIMLTDLEAVFRSLKSELGMRPIYHHKEERVSGICSCNTGIQYILYISGHIFITLLAYHLVHTLRLQLKAGGIHDSWQTLRCKMENQQRVTAVFQCKSGKTVHLRKSTRAEPEQKQIYDVLGVTSQPGCSHKTWV